MKKGLHEELKKKKEKKKNSPHVISKPKVREGGMLRFGNVLVFIYFTD